jgi:hypothetical protein
LSAPTAPRLALTPYRATCRCHSAGALLLCGLMCAVQAGEKLKHSIS